MTLSTGKMKANENKHTVLVRKLQREQAGMHIIRKVVMAATMEELQLLSSAGFSEEAKVAAKGRIRALTSESRLQRAMEISKSYEMSISDAAAKCSVAPKRIRERMRKEGFDYDWKKVARKVDNGMMLDRLHYHKWGANLKMKDDFFKVIKELF